jgi:hypothetical protein
VREFVTGEASHERYFMEALTRWGVTAAAVLAAVPLASTAGFIGLQYRLAHRSLLDYLAGSAVLEVDPEVYARNGDPYQLWESVYDIAPEILAPVRQHIRDDVLGGHASLFRQIALDAAPEEEVRAAIQAAGQLGGDLPALASCLRDPAVVAARPLDVVLKDWGQDNLIPETLKERIRRFAGV